MGKVIHRSLAAQAVTPLLAHSEQINTPLYTPPNQSPDQAVDRGAAAKSQEPPDTCSKQAQNGPTGSSTTIQLDVPYKIRDAGIVAQDWRFGDNALSHPQEDFRDDGSISAQTTDGPFSLKHRRQTDKIWLWTQQYCHHAERIRP